jgi:hypothetical protein
MSVFGAIVGSVTDIPGKTTRGTAFLQKRRRPSIATIEAPSHSASPTQLGSLETTTQTRVQHLQSVEMMSGLASTTSRQPITVAPCA